MIGLPTFFYFSPKNPKTNNKPTKLYNGTNGTNGCLKEMPPRDKLLIILRNCFIHAEICTGDCDDVLRKFFIYFMNINDEYKNILNNMQKELEDPITVENKKKINKMGKNSGNQNSKNNKIAEHIKHRIKKIKKKNTDEVITLMFNHNNHINNPNKKTTNNNPNNNSNNKKNTNNNPNNKTIEKILEDFISNIKSNPKRVENSGELTVFA